MLFYESFTSYHDSTTIEYFSILLFFFFLITRKLIKNSIGEKNTNNQFFYWQNLLHR